MSERKSCIRCVRGYLSYCRYLEIGEKSVKCLQGVKLPDKMQVNMPLKDCPVRLVSKEGV